MPEIGELVTTFGVAVIGGVVAPQVSQARARRDARAAAAERLCHVEEARWWPATYGSFRSALASFEAAALVAGVPRAIINHYVGLTRVAKYASYQAGEAGPEDTAEGGGHIDKELANAVWSAAELIRDVLWYPWRTRPRRNARLAALVEVRKGLLSTVTGPSIRWDLYSR